ncbi:hypothetical protein [Natronococcus jeotgali]|uniref:Uncharacterized protein n=1 Tax=Natronococcus jeotgali DSM 18795 TaxID=1227498 RepID=L9XJ98_9EURY|nr:hypothetical protein [Natronococcus jeotgali]ELY61667.1 hypothetical protein C492_09205 [Natronococcus jeotgali DSM 18795]
MEVWLQAARIAAGVNVVLLLALGSIWLRNYRQHGAHHTLGLLVFDTFLLVQNLLWLYFYILHPDFIGWFVNSGTDVQIGVTMLCGLELVAILFLARITWI